MEVKHLANGVVSRGYDIFLGATTPDEEHVKLSIGAPVIYVGDRQCGRHYNWILAGVETFVSALKVRRAKLIINSRRGKLKKCKYGSRSINKQINKLYSMIR